MCQVILKLLRSHSSILRDFFSGDAGPMLSILSLLKLEGSPVSSPTTAIPRELSSALLGNF